MKTLNGVLLISTAMKFIAKLNLDNLLQENANVLLLVQS